MTVIIFNSYNFPQPASGGGGGEGGGSSSIIWRGATGVADGNGNGDRTFALPAGTSVNDKAFLIYFNAVGTTSWSLPSGFDTPIVDINFSGHGQLVISKKTSDISSGDTGAGNLVISLTTSGNALAAALITGTNINSTAMDATAQTRSATSDFTDPSVLDLPTITTVTNKANVLWVATTRSTTPAWANKPSGSSDLLAQSNGTFDANLWIGFKEITTAGAVSATSVQSAGFQYELTSTLAVRPS